MAQADYNETIFDVVRLDAEHRCAEMVSDAGLMPALGREQTLAFGALAIAHRQLRGGLAVLALTHDAKADVADPEFSGIRCTGSGSQLVDRHEPGASSNHSLRAIAPNNPCRSVARRA